MAGVTVKLDGKFKKQLQAAFKNHKADVGILQDKAHKAAGKGLKKLAGGPARRTSRTVDGTLTSVSESFRRHTGINIFTKPFRLKANREILRFATQYVRFMVNSKNMNRKRIENLMQAIVRNPILRGDYGANKSGTAKSKGFNRLGIDTGQLFKGITARVRGRVTRV